MGELTIGKFKRMFFETLDLMFISLREKFINPNN